MNVDDAESRPRRLLMVISRNHLAGIVATAVPLLVYLAVIGNGFGGSSFLIGDCPYYLAAARSIAEDGDLDIGNQLWQPWSAHSTHVALDQEGRFVPKHPLWMSVAVIPFLLMVGDSGALLFNLLQLMVLSVLMYCLARRVNAPWPAAGAVCLTSVFSFLPHYAWNFSPDVFSAVLLLGALVTLPSDRSPHRGRHLLAGLLLGVATTAKPSFALAALALPLLLGKPFRKTIPALVLGGMVPVLLWMGLNQHLFGAPLTTPYDRIVHFTDSGIELHSNREDFTESVWRGVRDQLIRPERGLLPTSPVTVASFLLLPFLWARDKRWALYIGVTSLAIYLFYSSYTLWVTSHWGNRFLMPVVVLGVLPLAAALDRRRSASEKKTTPRRNESEGSERAGRNPG